MFGDNFLGYLRGDPFVKRIGLTLSLNSDQRSPAARSHTTGGDNLDLFGQLMGLNCLLDNLLNRGSAGGKTGRTATAEQPAAKLLLLLLFLLSDGVQIITVHKVSPSSASEVGMAGFSIG